MIPCRFLAAVLCGWMAAGVVGKRAGGSLEAHAERVQEGAAVAEGLAAEAEDVVLGAHEAVVVERGEGAEGDGASETAPIWHSFDTDLVAESNAIEAAYQQSRLGHGNVYTATISSVAGFKNPATIKFSSMDLCGADGVCLPMYRNEVVLSRSATTAHLGAARSMGARSIVVTPGTSSGQWTSRPAGAARVVHRAATFHQTGARTGPATGYTRPEHKVRANYDAYLLEGGDWVRKWGGDGTERIKPKVLVIGPGGGEFMNQQAWHELASAVELQFARGAKQTYDGYPPNWQGDDFEAMVQAQGEASDGVNMHPTPKNLASFAVEVAIPLIKQFQPDVVICGSRGGQVVMPTIWHLGWRGPTIMMNGGLAMRNSPIVPQYVRLALMVFGHEMSAEWPNSISNLQERIQVEDGEAWQLLYSDPASGHMPNIANGRMATMIKLLLEGYSEEWNQPIEPGLTLQAVQR